MIEYQKYWCCKENAESEDYGDCAPVRPWQGILKFHCLHRFDENDVIDEDPNAYAVVKEKDLFDNREDAVKHYRNCCLREIKILKEQIYNFEAEVQMCNEGKL